MAEISVEVNMENIIKYNLVELTGNTTDKLLGAAAVAQDEGYVLTCKIPWDEPLEHNLFEASETTEVRDEYAGQATTWVSDPIDPENPLVIPGEVIKIERDNNDG